jgi:hypothetical protein
MFTCFQVGWPKKLSLDILSNSYSRKKIILLNYIKNLENE